MAHGRDGALLAELRMSVERVRAALCSLAASSGLATSAAATATPAAKATSTAATRTRAASGGVPARRGQIAAAVEFVLEDADQRT